MNLFDRLLVRSYIKAYLICLVSILSLYVVVDLFTNVEDFVEKSRGLGETLRRIGTWYGYMVVQFFDRLSEAIVLLAAMFTVAWMQRNNELLPLLSAGVSTHRVVLPVVLGACVMLGVSLVNQEVVIPRISGNLLVDRNDWDGDKPILVHGAYEPNGILIKGESAKRNSQRVEDFSVVIPESLAREMIHLSAKEAYYYPPGEGPVKTGGWLLTGTMPPEPVGWICPEGVLKHLDAGKYFLHTEDVDFDCVTRSRTWFVFASTPRLLSELNRSDSTRLASMAVLFHMRLTRPILGLLLVFMGLAVILRDQNQGVFISTALCLVMCGLFFAARFACKHLGDNEYLSPALAAWLPVLGFGPLAFVLFDAIHT